MAQICKFTLISIDNSFIRNFSESSNQVPSEVPETFGTVSPNRLHDRFGIFQVNFWEIMDDSAKRGG